MKLIIQIPCYNEETSLPIALSFLPRQVPGFDCVEWLIIDDGSTDDTVGAAVRHGVDHIVRHTGNKGLARSFMTGLEACLRLGADVIVNTDADNQYNAADIPSLTAPIVAKEADIAIGARPISTIEDFSPLKKILQRLGSFVVRAASGTDIRDAPSGFRAISRNAAKKLFVFNNYTYTLETIIQAGQRNISIVSVPVRVNPSIRPSRLMKSTASYIERSIVTILRILVIYRPFHFFLSIGFVLFGSGFFIGLRFLVMYLSGDGGGHVQSLVLASILLCMGFQAILAAFIADLLAANRKILEDIRLKTVRMSLSDTLPFAPSEPVKTQKSHFPVSHRLSNPVESSTLGQSIS